MSKRPIALLSVTNKNGITELARELALLGYHIISTGGTAKLLQTAGINVDDVSSLTGANEYFGGLVKSIHPKVAGGILHNRQNNEHIEEAKRLNISAIDLVVCNLYDFEAQCMTGELDVDTTLSYIDIGGPTMLRSAAKNYHYCLPVIDPADYPWLVEKLKKNDLTTDDRRQLASKTFAAISRYDHLIAQTLATGEKSINLPSENQKELPASLTLKLDQIAKLRYGENPHQLAAIYTSDSDQSIWKQAELLNGKALSYNNYLDMYSALEIISEFSLPCITIVKHNNPCGAAIAREPDPNKTASDHLANIFKRALACDSQSAFGGIIASNRVIDELCAQNIFEGFFECIVAPDFSSAAFEILRQKKNLRLVKIPSLEKIRAQLSQQSSIKSIGSDYLIQKLTAQSHNFSLDQCQWLGKKYLSDEQRFDLNFAWRLVKHVKSNAIVIVKDGNCVGVGAGQMSRIDAVEIAIKKARATGNENALAGAVLASDAFFPFRDGIDAAAKVGIKAIIQPGGSIRDEEVIHAAEEQHVALVLTGMRHFKH